jgi:hypothetical protein
MFLYALLPAHPWFLKMELQGVWAQHEPDFHGFSLLLHLIEHNVFEMKHLQSGMHPMVLLLSCFTRQVLKSQNKSR